MLITRTCPFCNKPHTREIDIDEQTLYRIENRRKLGLMIQTIIPHLTANEREFFITGAHPTCWDTLFTPVETQE